MEEHSNPPRIFIPPEEDSPRSVQRSFSETDAINDLQTLDDRTDLFGGDACMEEQSLKGKDLTSSGNDNIDHNFDSRHWDVCSVRDLRDQNQILSDSNRRDFIAVINEDLKMHRGNFLHPTEQVCSGSVVESDNMWLQHRKSHDLGEKFLEKMPTAQTLVHTTPITKSNFASQPVEFAPKGIDTMSCPDFQNNEYDVDDEYIETALGELKQSANEISRSFGSKAKSPNNEAIIWKEVCDDNSQFRHPSTLSPISNQSLGVPWSTLNTKTFLIKEMGEVKSSVKKLGKEIRSSLSPFVYSHSGLSTRKTLTDATDGLYSGDVTLSHSFESPTIFQLPESVDFSNAARDTNKDARGIDRENLRGCVSSIVVNKQERQKTFVDSVLKSYETCLKYPDFPSKAETDEQVTSESSDRFAGNTRDQANGLDETRALENAGDFSGSTTSLNSSIKSSDVQEDLLNRMFRVLQNLQDIFTSEHHPLCKGVHSRALEIVSFLKGIMRHDSIPQTFGENRNISYREQNKAVHSLSSRMSTTSSSFLDKVKYTDLMNHTSTKIDRSGSGRVTPCQQTWPTRTNHPECPIEFRPRETLNGRIKRVICELYCEIQPLEDGIKEKALAMLEEMHGIVESLQVYEQSEDFTSSNETPNIDTQQDFAPNFRASCCEASGHFSHEKCNVYNVENERYNGSNRSLRQKTPERDSPCSQMTQPTTTSLSIENIRGRIKSLIHKHSDLTPEETNRKILSVLCDMEKVLATLGQTESLPEDEKMVHADKADESQKSQFPVSSKMAVLIKNLQDAILVMRPNLQIADYDPQSKICFLLNILTDELQSERTESSTLKDVEGLLNSLESELCENGVGNSILAICIREMIEVVTIVVAESLVEEESKCKSKVRKNDTAYRKGKERCDNVSKTDTVKSAICNKSHKKGNCICKSEPKVIEEVFMESGEDCETMPCETVKMATATCDTLKAEEKHVCKSEPSCVRKREASTERLRSCHDIVEENREVESPCPSNRTKMDFLVVTGEHYTAPNRCYSEVIFNPTESITACTEAADSPLTQILAKLRDLVKMLEMEDSTLQQCTILKIIETFNHIETTLDLDPQYATLLREARKTLCHESGEKREAQPCQEREGSCSRWRKISRRHRNRSNNFTLPCNNERFFGFTPPYVKKHAAEVKQGNNSLALNSIWKTCYCRKIFRDQRGSMLSFFLDDEKALSSF
ncbi:hypothetical protein TSMEX_002769 [Taenia solium]|eukprot:TsM_000652200 transcript=TsM_000652200 gene=TsM_000652200